MSSACCPIAPNNETNKKLIKHGENGFLYNNIHEMKEICNKLILSKDYLMNICNNARKTVIEEFNFENFINNWNKYLTTASNNNWWENYENKSIN